MAQQTSSKKLTNADMDILTDKIIQRIWKHRHLSGILDEEIYVVLRKALEVMTPEPASIHVSAPCILFGDIHGQLGDLIRFLTIIGPPPKNKILFLGDYVDRCKKSLEVILLLLCYKVKYPQHIYLLRGNHECAKMNRVYGFYEEMRRKRNVTMWKKFNQVFNELPLCATISKKILCMHGGISPRIVAWNDLDTLQKPRLPKLCDDGIAVDLMWSDPTEDGCCPQFQFNKNRATSVMFGSEAVDNICLLLDVKLVVRAHEVVKEGHAFTFNDKLLTLFSAPNYCGNDGNCGSIMKVTDKLELSFVSLKPILDRHQLTLAQQAIMEKQAKQLAIRSPDPNARISHPTEAIENKSH